MNIFSHRLLIAAAVLEVATGLQLIVAPALFVQLLLGDELAGAGLAAGRVAGFALAALGVSCWPGSQIAGAEHRAHALRGMLVYNLLITVYLIGLGATSQSVGLFLWPGVVLHGILTLLFARELFRG